MTENVFRFLPFIDPVERYKLIFIDPRTRISIRYRLLNLSKISEEEATFSRCDEI